jgi:hypothetical protein
MYLFELFDDEGSMTDLLRSQVMDYLTPLAANGVESVPIQNIADVLRNSRTGLVIDRGLIMRLLEPDVCKLVKEIQGDKVYLALPVDDMSAKREEDKEKDREQINRTAENKAKQEISKQ